METSISINNQNISMSSRDIADLVCSRHDHVRVSIDRLAQRGVISLPAVRVKPTAGRPSVEYVFFGEQGKRDSIIVVAQLSPEFTAKLVDRWQHLENQYKNKPVQLPDFNDPVAAARAWADAKESEQVATQRLEEVKPKVEVYDRINDNRGSVTLTQVAKTIGVGPKNLISKLLDDKVIYRTGQGLTAYQNHINERRFIVVQGEKNGHVYYQLRVTASGVQWLVNKYVSELGE